jgi:hypothetical protein
MEDAACERLSSVLIRVLRWGARFVEMAVGSAMIRPSLDRSVTDGRLGENAMLHTLIDICAGRRIEVLATLTARAAGAGTSTAMAVDAIGACSKVARGISIASDTHVSSGWI